MITISGSGCGGRWVPTIMLFRVRCARKLQWPVTNRNIVVWTAGLPLRLASLCSRYSFKLVSRPGADREPTLSCPSQSSSKASVLWASVGSARVTDRGLLLVGCLTSQQHADVSQGRICSDNLTRCHTQIVAADQTFYLTQSQYTDTGPTSPTADPITPGAWQGSLWSACF